MLSPIVRSVQRISIRNWAHSSSSLASLQQVDAKCSTSNKEQQTTLTQRLSTTPQLNFSSLATESKLVTAGFESHLAYTDLLEERSSEVVQESNIVSIYHQLPSKPDQNVEYKSKWEQAKRQRALQKFTVAEEKLLKNDPAACKLFQAIKAPLLELERFRASALIDTKACRKFIDNNKVKYMTNICFSKSGTLISQIGDIQDPATAIVISNPGAGILSQELLRLGAKQLILFEANPEIRAHLKVSKSIFEIWYTTKHNYLLFSENP